MAEALLVMVALPVLCGTPIALLALLLITFRRTTLLKSQVLTLEAALEDMQAQVKALQVGAPRSTAAPSSADEARSSEAPSSDPVVEVELLPLPAEPTPSESSPTTEPRPQPGPVPVPPPRTPPPPEPAVPVGPPPRPPITPERLAMWLAAGLGGLSVVLASLFALSAAIDRGWVGPAFRIGIGLTLGTAAWWGGTVARSRRLQWGGSALVGAGVAGICGTLYASNVRFDLLSTPVTFGLLALVSMVALWSGVRQGSRFDSWLGLIGGLATPALVQATEPRPLVLFGYLGVLVAGTVGAAARRGWVDLIVGAALGFAAVFFGWTAEASRPSDQPIALGVVIFLGVVFATASRWTREDGAPKAVPAITGAILPLLALPWLLPAEPVFADPVTSILVYRPTPNSQWLAAGGLVLALAPAVVGSRILWAQRVAGVMAVGLACALAYGQCDGPSPPWFAVAAALGAVPLLGIGLRSDVPDPEASASWLLPVATGAGAAVALSSGPADAQGILALCLVSVLPGVLLALLRKNGALFLPALIGATLPLSVAATLVPEVGPAPVAGPAALAFGLFGTLPLLARSAAARNTVAAALAGPACFYPLYRSWEAAGGEALIGILPVLMGAVALLGALTLIRQHGARRDSGPLALFVGVSLLGITAAIPLQLRDQWVTVAWSLEGVAVAWASRRLDHRLLRSTAVLLGMAVTVRLVANPWALEYANAGGLPILNWTLYTWGVPALALLGSAQLLGPAARPRPLVPEWVRLGLVLCAVAVGFALVNVQVSHAFQDSGPIELGGHGIWQGMVRSLAWAGYGIAILAAGTWRDHRVIRMIGFVVVLVAAGKVFLSDLWSLSGFVRVGSIAGLGVTLLVAAFVFERLVLRRTSDDPGGPR